MTFKILRTSLFVATTVLTTTLAFATEFSEFTEKKWQAQETATSPGVLCNFSTGEIGRLSARATEDHQAYFWEKKGVDSRWQTHSFSPVFRSVENYVSEPRKLMQFLSMTAEQQTTLVSPKHISVLETSVYTYTLVILSWIEQSREISETDLKISDDGKHLEMIRHYTNTSRTSPRPRQMTEYCLLKAIQ